MHKRRIACRVFTFYFVFKFYLLIVINLHLNFNHNLKLMHHQTKNNLLIVYSLILCIYETLLNSLNQQITV